MTCPFFPRIRQRRSSNRRQGIVCSSAFSILALSVAFSMPVPVWGDAIPSNAPASRMPEEVAQILKVRCVACHGPTKQEGKLNLSLPQTISRGGESGVAIDRERPLESLLWKKIIEGEMPPEEPLEREEQEILRQWLEQGSAGIPGEPPPLSDHDEHWANQPLRETIPPSVQHLESVRNEIDHFILSPLEQSGGSLRPEAERRELIRRVALDLTGVPPTVEEVELYLQDSSVDAYEQMVDRYLASPRYGERWGKFWLDTAGYADSNGYFNADTDRPLAYRYRDYVVRSINADKPFDAFVREQLAGDEMSGYTPGVDATPRMIELLEATHYLRNAPDGTDSSDGNDNERTIDKLTVLEGAQQIIGSSLLGITLQCAKCHDHKFEPFTQRDYYQLQAFVYPALNVKNWVMPKDRHVIAAPLAERQAWEAKGRELDAKIAATRREFAEWLTTHQGKSVSLFQADFNDPERMLAEEWTNTVPGDDASAGLPAVNLDSTTAPAARAHEGKLYIQESGAAGDRALVTRQTFDWTPDLPGGWIQLSFDLVNEGEPAPYVGLYIALKDYNDRHEGSGGNVLIEGSTTRRTTIYLDYPGADSQRNGEIGAAFYQPGHRYGVRVANTGDGKYELTQFVDGIPEENTMVLTANHLPDGAFGFVLCCGRSYVVDNFAIESSSSHPSAQPVLQQLAADLPKRHEQFRAQLGALNGERRDEPGKIAIVRETSGDLPEVFLLKRGLHNNPGEQVVAGPPSVLQEVSNPYQRKTDIQNSTGVRTAFAEWLTRPGSRVAARLARVTANRWWQNHFGTGIVPTVDNLGYSGTSPTHPELLEYLAGQLVQSGWSQKAFHRLILLSATYRQSSLPEANASPLFDPRRIDRFPLRRMDGEAVRDSMLFVSGELDQQFGGPYIPTTRGDDGEVVVDEKTTGALRRSLYLQQRRTQVLGMLESFDAPAMVVNCTQRPSTTIPQQSLSLMNSQFVRRRAEAFAARLEREAGGDVSSKTDLAYQLAYSRLPTEDEQTAIRKFLTDQAATYGERTDRDQLSWADLCQALLSSNEFLYVR